jgi:hypothetical protein
VLAAGDRLPTAVIAEGYWIIKPSAGYGGEGIRLLRAGDATAADYRAPVPVVVQEYLTNPHRGIVDRRGFYKFDLRVNFLVLSAGEIYRYRPVFVRVSDAPFDPDSADIGVHITNIHGRPATAWNARQLHQLPGLAAYSAEVDKFSAEVLSPLLRRYIIDGHRSTAVTSFQYFGADLFLTDAGELRLLEINDVPGDAGADIMNIWRVATAFQYHGGALPPAFGAIAQYFELVPNAQATQGIGGITDPSDKIWRQAPEA